MALTVGLGYLVAAQRHYLDSLNYTLVIATAFLHGHLGIATAPSWLNEMVRIKGSYYSVFPLGAVLSVLPFSALVAVGWPWPHPAPIILALLAVATTLLGYGLTALRPDLSLAKRLMLAAWIPVASWFLPNMLFGGAWQLALGFAVVGELGALYFSLVRRRPWLAGIFFAVGFGNRTEILLTAPVIVYFLLKPRLKEHPLRQVLRTSWAEVLRFCAVPAALLLATFAYNWARFGSISDFGYARIPGILHEPWYQHGIFSLSAIPANAETMLWHNGWHWIQNWPYLLPDPFGSSVLLATPFLALLLWRWRRGDRLVLWPTVAAIAVLTFVLWLHGNTGGWQFSYRYGLVLIPWLLLVLVERLPSRVTLIEGTLWMASASINVFAAYLFLWSGALT